MNALDVIKLDHAGREVFRYPGWELARDGRSITLEAFFSWGDTPVEEVVLQQGDRFVETYFSDRWYNIFEIYDHNSGALKAYYCNIGYPAEIGLQAVSYRDLALDLLVLPDGRQFVLDEVEFVALEISPAVRDQAMEGLRAVREEIQHKLSGLE